MSSATKGSDAVGVREDSAAEKTSSSISLTSLNVQQLSDVKKQLEDELKHLTTSFASLKSAQVKFTSCIENIDSLTEANKKMLVPLTSSLYVPGELSNLDEVIVDIGTGYYVSKSKKDAKEYYDKKVKFLTKELELLQTAIETKQQNLQMTMGILQNKLREQNAKNAGSSS